MTCGGFHKKDLDFSFDYKSRDWENSNSKPVCVACLNESRAHQIPGNFEHTCGKRVDNTQLPAEVMEEINKLQDDLTSIIILDDSFNKGYYSGMRTGIEAGATEYASKLHEIEQKNLELDEWKSQAMYLLNPLYEYGDNSKEIKLGESITTFILSRCKKYDAARTLLEKVKSRHEAGLLPDRFLYEEIKTFLK
jgi:hypothetical protein